jgi:hypothetical protein
VRVERTADPDKRFSNEGKMMRRMALAAMLVLGLVAAVGAGTAQARLDPSFGQGGILYPRPPVPAGWSSAAVSVVATGGDGQVFVTDRQFPHCPSSGPCEGGDYVFDYLADGSLNAAFAGSRGYRIPAAGPSYSTPLLAVGSSGLPIVAEYGLNPGQPFDSIVLQRLLASGAPDPGFGIGGTTSLSCACRYGEPKLLAGPHGSTMVAVTEELETKNGAVGAATLFKLNAAGLPAKGFGSDGSTNVRIPGAGRLEYEALAPSGAMYFGGVGQSTDTYQGALTKVSANGKVDDRFARTATRSLRRLLLLKRNEQLQVRTAVVGRNGEVELFGSRPGSGGFELKLWANGALERDFARKGLRTFGRSIVAAVGGSGGATMALAEGSSLRMLRILADGRVDRAFGRTGEELPGLSGSGITLSPAGKGKVDVVDLDLQECRFICRVSPKIYRFLER